MPGKEKSVVGQGSEEMRSPISRNVRETDFIQLFVDKMLYCSKGK